MKKYFRVEKIGLMYIVVRPNGTRFTENKFSTKEEAENFLLKIEKHAEEFMAAIKQHGAN